MRGIKTTSGPGHGRRPCNNRGRRVQPDLAGLQTQTAVVGSASGVTARTSESRNGTVERMPAVLFAGDRRPELLAATIRERDALPSSESLHERTGGFGLPTTDSTVTSVRSVRTEQDLIAEPKFSVIPFELRRRSRRPRA